MMRAMRWLLAAILLGGCQTNFVGDAHIDPASCVQKCQSARLEMVGMVYLGEYSSACICEIPRPPGAAPAPAAPGAAGGAAGAAAGVVMQMRQAAQQQQMMLTR
jgi:hypothetical protein